MLIKSTRPQQIIYVIEDAQLRGYNETNEDS